VLRMGVARGGIRDTGVDHIRRMHLVQEAKGTLRDPHRLLESGAVSRDVCLEPDVSSQVPGRDGGEPEVDAVIQAAAPPER